MPLLETKKNHERLKKSNLVNRTQKVLVDDLTYMSAVWGRDTVRLPTDPAAEQ